MTNKGFDYALFSKLYCIVESEDVCQEYTAALIMNIHISEKLNKLAAAYLLKSNCSPVCRTACSTLTRPWPERDDLQLSLEGQLHIYQFTTKVGMLTIHIMWSFFFFLQLTVATTVEGCPQTTPTPKPTKTTADDNILRTIHDCKAFDIFVK